MKALEYTLEFKKSESVTKEDWQLPKQHLLSERVIFYLWSS